MRTGATSIVVAVILAGGLTVCGNPNLESVCKDRIERLAGKLETWVCGGVHGLRTRLKSDEQAMRPGPTCALLVSKDMIVGLDARGCTTCREPSFRGDLAAITGFAAGCDSVGQRLSSPEVILGLAVVRAFSRSADLADLLSEINVEDLGNPRLVLCGGVMVELGTGDYHRKIMRLRQVLLQAPELGIRPTRVDMRFGPQVVVEYEEMSKQARKEV
jgi:hypothetical protein